MRKLTTLTNESPNVRGTSPVTFSWTYSVTRSFGEIDAIDRRLAEATPSAGLLVEWANKPENRPPQSWFDNDDDPFTLDD